MIRIVQAGDRRIAAFNARPAFPEEAEKAAADVLADIRKNGDAAVRRYVAKFEGFKGRNLRVERTPDPAEIPAAVRKAVEDAHRRVLKFSKASLRKAWTMRTPKGGVEGEFYSPMDRVGVYVPGGTAPLASTSIMTVTLAQAAGVKEIVAARRRAKRARSIPFSCMRSSWRAQRKSTAWAASRPSGSWRSAPRRAGRFRRSSDPAMPT